MTGLFASLISAATGQDTPLTPRLRGRFEEEDINPAFANEAEPDGRRAGPDQSDIPLRSSVRVVQADDRITSKQTAVAHAAALQSAQSIGLPGTTQPESLALRPTSRTNADTSNVPMPPPRRSGTAAAVAASASSHDENLAHHDDTGTDTQSDAPKLPEHFKAPTVLATAENHDDQTTLLPPTLGNNGPYPAPSRAPAAPANDSLLIKIGRIEVRPLAPPPPQHSARQTVTARPVAIPRAAPRQSLDDYRARRRP